MEWEHIILAVTLAPWYLTGPDMMLKCHKKFGIHAWTRYHVSVSMERGTYTAYVSYQIGVQ